jgi:iron transport multicopper oxidase
MPQVAPAQRYTFLLTAKATASNNYAFTAALDTNRDYTQPGAVWPLNLTGYLIYDSKKDLPSDFIVQTWENALDDTSLVPLDHKGLFGEPDQTITLDFNFGTDSVGIPR